MYVCKCGYLSFFTTGYIFAQCLFEFLVVSNFTDFSAVTSSFF